MKHGWIEAPKNFDELPWSIKAGKRVIWWVAIEAHGEYSAKSFAIIGSLVQLHPQQEPYTVDKENPSSGFYYHTLKAYKEIGRGPYDE